MGLFDEIPIRENGDDFEASWVNILRSKLIEFFGSGISTPAPFTIADNQSSPADITDLVFDKDEIVYALVRYIIFRTDGSTPRRESGWLELTYVEADTDWDMQRRVNVGDALNDGANSLQITSAGQVQYSSDSMGGSYSGTLTWKIVETIAKES